MRDAEEKVVSRSKQLSCAVTVIAWLAAGEAHALHCTATLRLDDPATLAALQLSIAYPAGSDIDGSGDAVACTNLAPAAAVFHDDDSGTLTAAFVGAGEGFSGPLDLATCEITAAAHITGSDITVQVIDATPPNASLAVSADVVCDGDVTTTTSTTTTTLSDTTECAVTVGLDDPVTIGSLQVVVAYGAADGDFAGSGSKVECSTLVGGTLGSYFDDENQDRLTGAVINLAGLSGPASLFTCTFLPGAVLPEAADFSLSITDAGDTDSVQIFPRPSVTVSSVICVDPTLAVCGNGALENGEQCDDGNLVSRDGCNSACVVDTVCGDADLNSRLTAVDAQRILRASVGLPPECPLDVCDTSGDNNLTTVDAQRVLRSSVGISTSLSCN
jgi:cysteine-rich repeat protein